MRAIDELRHVTEIAAAVLSCRGAICWFDPGGEMLHDRDALDRILDRHRSTGPRALELWTNVRLFNITGQPRWLLMDTVGMGQVDAPDHEACFEKDRYDPGEVAGFLRSISDYVVDHGEGIIKDGDTADGPGARRWQARRSDDSLVPPPRPVLRWLPLDGVRVPAEFVSRHPRG
jgi:hypothetical protein